MWHWSSNAAFLYFKSNGALDLVQHSFLATVHGCPSGQSVTPCGGPEVEGGRPSALQEVTESHGCGSVFVNSVLGPLNWLCPAFALCSHHLALDVTGFLQVLMPPTWGVWFDVGK